MSRAIIHARALEARLSTVKLTNAIVIVVGDRETSAAARLLADGDIAAFVAYADTAGGVLVQRHTDCERLAFLIDRAVEIAAQDCGTAALDLEDGGVA
jgi:hypothetical protein